MAWCEKCYRQRTSWIKTSGKKMKKSCGAENLQRCKKNVRHFWMETWGGYISLHRVTFLFIEDLEVCIIAARETRATMCAVWLCAVCCPNCGPVPRGYPRNCHGACSLCAPRILASWKGNFLRGILRNACLELSSRFELDYSVHGKVYAPGPRIGPFCWGQFILELLESRDYFDFSHNTLTEVFDVSFESFIHSSWSSLGGFRESKKKCTNPASGTIRHHGRPYWALQSFLHNDL